MAIKDIIRNWLESDIERLTKDDAGETTSTGMSDGNRLITQPQMELDPKNVIGAKAIIDDPYYEQASSSTVFRQKITRLSNKLLRDVSLRDWVCSAIIQCRADTATQFSRPMHDKFDKGFKVVKRDGSDCNDQDKEEVKIIEDFIYHCGRTDQVPAGHEMLFGEFLKLTVRDALTFGNIAIEKILTRGGSLHRFRPMPSEQMYHVNKNASKELIEQEIGQAKKLRAAAMGANNPAREYTVNEPEIDYYKYMQVGYDNRNLAVFGDADMIWKLYNPQNFADSQGYCYSPLELAVINITSHLNVENYNTQFFTHGYAARGVLHLKGMVTQNQLTGFRRQFYNSISGVQNSWRTPIISGLEDVQWVPLSGNARDMEYIAFNDHIVRALCAQFQIDPTEIGLDYLAHPTGKSPMQQANNEYKIEASKERGFTPLLMFYEDLINCDVLPAMDPELAKKYKFMFVGYNDMTPQSEIAHMQAEMTVYSSMNDLLSRAQKKKLEPAGDLPLNQIFWALVEKNYTKGEIRERFFGDKGATQRPELQYIPGDSAFLAWQEFLAAKEDKKKAEEAQQQQMALQQSQEGREQETHEREGEAHKNEQQQQQEAHEKDMSEQTIPASIHDAAKTYGTSATSAPNIGGKLVKNPTTDE